MIRVNLWQRSLDCTLTGWTQNQGSRNGIYEENVRIHWFGLQKGFRQLRNWMQRRSLNS